MSLPAFSPIGRRLAAVAVSALTVASLAACQKPAPSDQTAPADAAASAASASAAAPLPASEYFETLTEQALTATPAELQTVITQAKTAAARDVVKLSPAAASELKGHLQAIDTEFATLSRADLAISSIEAFRLFVSAGAGADVVPTEVSLLDYAGFRYAVDVGATPVRWEDADKAADVAAVQWDVIAPRVTDVGLRGRFGAAVIALKSAVRDNDAPKAAQAAQAELDLVDALETYFQGAGR